MKYLQIFVVGIFLLTLQNTAAEKLGEWNCSDCHSSDTSAGIYEQWLESTHSDVWENPTIQKAIKKSLIDTDGKTAGLCIRCKAPMAYITGGYSYNETEIAVDIDNPEYAKGIPCEFCHIVKGTNTENIAAPGSYMVNWEDETAKIINETMLGPISDPVNVDHPTAYSEVHKDSIFCASCHEFTTPKGVKNCETYSEWYNSTYKGEKTCQDCHMVVVSGIAGKDPEDGEMPVRDVNSHNIPGGHNTDMLKKAVSLDISASYSENGKGFEISVNADITNKGAGHRFPTGSPKRIGIINVTVKDESGNVIYTEEKQYKKVLGLEDGTATPKAWLATQILSDNRIYPGEKRSEVFSFEVNEPGDYNVELLLGYKSGAEKPLVEIEKKTTTVSVKPSVTPEVSPSETPTSAITETPETPEEKPTPGFEALYAIAGLIAVVYLLRKRLK